jgi:hypothetical protein
MNWNPSPKEHYFAKEKVTQRTSALQMENSNSSSFSNNH